MKAQENFNNVKDIIDLKNELVYLFNRLRYYNEEISIKHIENILKAIEYIDENYSVTKLD